MPKDGRSRAEPEGRGALHMGLGGISFGSLLLIFLIVIVLFGTKKLRDVGEDLGHAVRNFRRGLNGHDEKEQSETKAKQIE